MPGMLDRLRSTSVSGPGQHAAARIATRGIVGIGRLCVTTDLPGVSEMDDERVEGGAFLGREDPRHGLGVEGIRPQPVDGLGREGDEFAGPDRGRRLDDRGRVAAGEDARLDHARDFAGRGPRPGRVRRGQGRGWIRSPDQGKPVPLMGRSRPSRTGSGVASSPSALMTQEPVVAPVQDPAVAQPGRLVTIAVGRQAAHRAAVCSDGVDVALVLRFRAPDVRREGDGPAVQVTNPGRWRRGPGDRACGGSGHRRRRSAGRTVEDRLGRGHRGRRCASRPAWNHPATNAPLRSASSRGTRSPRGP